MPVNVTPSTAKARPKMPTRDPARTCTSTPVGENGRLKGLEGIMARPTTRYGLSERAILAVHGAVHTPAFQLNLARPRGDAFSGPNAAALPKMVPSRSLEMKTRTVSESAMGAATVCPDGRFRDGLVLRRCGRSRRHKSGANEKYHAKVSDTPHGEGERNARAGRRCAEPLLSGPARCRGSGGATALEPSCLVSRRDLRA